MGRSFNDKSNNQQIVRVDDQLKLIVDKNPNGITYEGTAKFNVATNESYWKIKRTETIGNETFSTFLGLPGGACIGDPIFVWDDRVTLFGDPLVADPDDISVYGALSVTTTATELKVNASVLAGRTTMYAQPQDGDVYFGFNSSVTTATGTKVAQDATLVVEDPDARVKIYLITSSGSVDVRIGEML